MMKTKLRVLVVLSFSLLLVKGFSQETYVHTSDGLKIISTQPFAANAHPGSLFSSRSELVQYWVTLYCFTPILEVSENHEIEKAWFIAFILDNYEGEFMVPQKSKLLLKLGDGSTMTLSSEKAVESDREWDGVDHWSAMCLYKVSEDELSHIMDDGVLKVRFYTEPKYFEHEFKKDAIGKILKKSHAAILKNLSDDF